MRFLAWVIFGAIIAPAAGAFAQSVSYASRGNAFPCQPAQFIAPNVLLCPSRIDQEGALDSLGCSGLEPAICTVSDQGVATGRGAPGVPREVRLLLVDPASAAPPTVVCETTSTVSTDIPISCSGYATFRAPLALGACMALRAHAEMTYVVGDARALATQTELAYSLCRSSAGVLTLARA